MFSHSAPARGVALALFAAFLWGVSGAIAADAFSAVSPGRVAQARFFVAALVLIPYTAWRGSLRIGDRFPLLVVFGLNIAVLTGAFYVALDRLGVGPGATLQFLGPVIVLFWMKYAQRREVSSVVWLAAFLAVLGTALVTQVWDLDALDLFGVAAGLAAAVLFASYLLIGERLTAAISPLTAVAYGALIAAVFWLVVLPPWTQPYGLEAKVWVELIWVGAGGTALPLVAELGAMRLVASGVVGVVATAEPVIAAAAAWVLLSQALSGAQIIGALMVTLAVASVQRWGLPEVEVPIEASR